MIYVTDALAIVGVGLLTYGLAQYSAPLGYIVPGVVLLVVGVRLSVPRKDR